MAQDGKWRVGSGKFEIRLDVRRGCVLCVNVGQPFFNGTLPLLLGPAWHGELPYGPVLLLVQRHIRTLLCLSASHPGSRVWNMILLLILDSLRSRYGHAGWS